MEKGDIHKLLDINKRTFFYIIAAILIFVFFIINNLAIFERYSQIITKVFQENEKIVRSLKTLDEIFAKDLNKLLKRRRGIIKRIDTEKKQTISKNSNIENEINDQKAEIDKINKKDIVKIDNQIEIIKAQKKGWFITKKKHKERTTQKVNKLIEKIKIKKDKIISIGEKIKKLEETIVYGETYNKLKTTINLLDTKIVERRSEVYNRKIKFSINCLNNKDQSSLINPDDKKTQLLKKISSNIVK